MSLRDLTNDDMASYLSHHSLKSLSDDHAAEWQAEIVRRLEDDENGDAR